MKKKILFVQNLLLLSAALSLAIFTTSCDREEDNPVTVTPSVDGNGGGTGGGDDGGGTGGGEFVEETLTFTVNGVDFVMKPVRGGTFWMGAQKDDPDGQNYDADAYDSESPVHQVTLSSYYMGETEVTQALWQAVTGQSPTSDGRWQWSSSDGMGDNYPAYFISWDDICGTGGFLEKLNAALSSELDGKHFDLPTEAQWEFAARGGNQSHGYKYAGSNTLGDVAWYWDNIPSQSSGSEGYGTQPVRTKSPNELGLYDMSGNLLEWCRDYCSNNYNWCSDGVTNPEYTTANSLRMFRGGSFNDSNAMNFRVSTRASYFQDDRYTLWYGFRLALLP